MRRLNSLDTHSAELHALFATLKDRIANPTEEQTYSGPACTFSNGSRLATSNTKLNNTSHCLSGNTPPFMQTASLNKKS